MEWYYAKNGQQMGPVTLEVLRAMISSGEVAPADLIWREGMAEWTPAGQVAEFSGGGVGHTTGMALPPGGSQIPQTLPQGAPGGLIAGMPPPTNSKAITSMICGIVGLFAPCLCGIPVIASIVAIIMGHVARGEIRDTGGLQRGEGMALTGLILGYLMVAAIAVLIVISFLEGLLS